MPRGKDAPWSEDARVLQAALEMACRPLGGSNTGGYGVAIRKVEKAVDTMNRLKGDELQRYADRHNVSKPELADALTKLRTLHDQAERHFSRAYLRSPRPGAAA